MVIRRAFYQKTHFSLFAMLQISNHLHIFINCDTKYNNRLTRLIHYSQFCCPFSETTFKCE